jgi:hypothetical protein
VKRWMAVVAGVFGLCIFTVVAVKVYLEIGLSRGEQWASLDGPEPTWPTALGFGAVYASAASGIVLVGLVVAAIVRAHMPLRGAGE